VTPVEVERLFYLQPILNDMLKTLKRIGILGVSCIFYLVVSTWNTLRWISGRVVHGTGVVLYYHSVPVESRASFAWQMDMLLDLTRPVPADACVRPDRGERYAAVTFDDGFQDVIDNALPELLSRNIPVTLFIVADALGKMSDWHDGGLSEYYSTQVMDEITLKSLPGELVTIGSQTLTHRKVTLLSDAEAWAETYGSRLKLERILRREVKLFSFPEGEFNEKLVSCCQMAGYSRVFTIVPSLAFRDPREFVRGRILARPTDWPLEFRLKLLGAYCWLPVGSAIKRKMISNSIVRGVSALLSSATQRTWHRRDKWHRSV